MDYDNIFMPRMPTFKSAVGRSTLIHEITPKHVTLRKEDIFRSLAMPYGQDPPDRHLKTMFHEINMVPPVSTYGREIRDLLTAAPPSKKVSRKEFLSRTFEVFMEVMERAWIPKKFHIVLHSGGYDSRLISYAIHELYIKNGKDWLGDLVFLEVQGEDEHSWAALKAEGWDRRRFVTYQEGLENSGEMILDRHCDFSGAWKRQNCGMFPKPFNHFYEPIAWLQDDGRVPSDDDQLQTWTGYLANDIAHALINKPGLQWVFRKLPYHPYLFAPAKGECVSPYLSLDLIKFVWMHGRDQEESQTQNYRRHILDWRSPAVGAVPNPQRGTVRGSLPLRLFNQVFKDYQESWYGRNVPIDAKQPTTVEYRTWWGYYGLASYCEELRRRGHKIGMPR